MYLRPTELQEALRALAARPMAVVAGGTDFYAQRVGQRVSEAVLDISGLAQLRGVEQSGGMLSAGVSKTLVAGGRAVVHRHRDTHRIR